MILVTGANGHLGKSTIKHLSRQIEADKITGLFRDPKKSEELIELGIDVRFADYEDTDSLRKAFTGIRKLVLISSPSQHATEDHKNVIDVAKEIGIEHIFYTSGLVADYNNNCLLPLMQPHVETEKYILESNTPYTILRNTMYYELIPELIGEDINVTGINFPAQDGKFSCALRDELGEALADVVANQTIEHKNKIYDLAGTQSYSFHNVAELLSKKLGKDITYNSPEKENFKAFLQHLGLPKDAIWFADLFGSAISNGDFDVPSPTLAKLLGRAPLDLEGFLRKVY